MSSSLVVEIDALIQKVKACPIKATVVASSKTTQAAPPKAQKQKQEEEKVAEKAPEPKKAAPAASGATTGNWLDCDSVTEGQTVEVASTWEELRKAWTECELGPVDDSDLQSYVNQVGKIQEIEDDDDTVQLRWENLDEYWIPIRCCKKTTKPLSSPAPVSGLLEEHEKPLVPTPGLVQVEGDYIKDIESVKEGQFVQVTEKLKKLIKAWGVAELGNVDDPTLNSFLLQTGKIQEIEEDDDTVQLEWENLDTMWIPISVCRFNLKGELSSPPPVSCLNPVEPEAEEVKPKFRIREYAMTGDSYLTTETCKAKQHYMVTLNVKYIEQTAEAAGIEGLNAEAVSGYVGRCTKIDGDKAEITFNNKKTATVAIASLHKPNKKKKKKGSPEL